MSSLIDAIGCAPSVPYDSQRFRQSSRGLVLLYGPRPREKARSKENIAMAFQESYVRQHATLPTIEEVLHHVRLKPGAHKPWREFNLARQKLAGELRIGPPTAPYQDTEGIWLTRRIILVQYPALLRSPETNQELHRWRRSCPELNHRPLRARQTWFRLKQGLRLLWCYHQTDVEDIVCRRDRSGSETPTPPPAAEAKPAEGNGNELPAETPPAGDSPPIADGGTVQLQGRGKPVVVDGKAKPLLTRAQYDVIEVLLNAGEKGLTKDELESQSGHGGARQILRLLANSDPDWADVISFPGAPGRGYRIP